MGDSAILGADGKPFTVIVKDGALDDTFAKAGTYEKQEHGGFTEEFVNALRTENSVGQGMVLKGKRFCYFPDAPTFASLTASDLDNYYRRAYTEEERLAHAAEIRVIRKQARAAKSEAMKGSDALVPHMFIPFKVGYALERSYPDEFSMAVRRERAMALLEGLMPDWVLVPQFTRRGGCS